MKRFVFAMFAALFLAGCASDDYDRGAPPPNVDQSYGSQSWPTYPMEHDFPSRVGPGQMK